MKRFASMMVALLLVTVCITSCKDEDNSSLAFDTPALYFTQAGEQAVATFSASGIAKFTISSTPAGWSDYVVLDSKSRTITVTAPAEPTDSEENFALSGNIWG